VSSWQKYPAQPLARKGAKTQRNPLCEPSWLRGFMAKNRWQKARTRGVFFIFRRFIFVCPFPDM
jgi:hypothetical protein